MSRRLPLVVAIACFSACGPERPVLPPATPPPGPAETAIQERALTAHIQMLSSDGFEGRAPATRGGDLAALYLATELQALGVAPAGESGTYFQQVPIVESTVDRNFALSVPGRSYRYY